MFYLLFVCGVSGLSYPFGTTVGAPVCKVPSCETCNVAMVEYSQAPSVKNVTHHVVGGLFWETELSGGKCCGDNCGSKGNILTQGFGECSDTGGSRRSWECGVCEDARCSCRRLSLEIIPTECVKCLSNYSLTPSAQCSLCPAGYFGDGVRCQAVNPCLSGGHNCDKNAACSYLGPGRFQCTCFRGYSGNGVSCNPIDVCATDTFACHPSAVCTTTGPGLYSCTCKAGYQGDGQVCRDVNECASPVQVCQPTEYCGNTPGSYVCSPCHELCSRGCMGPGPDQCQECKDYSSAGSCVRVCPVGTHVDEVRRQCLPCDVECLGECKGPGRQACLACVHVSFTASSIDNSTICLAECPPGYFATDTLFGHVCVACTTSRLGSYVVNNCTKHEDTTFALCPPGYRCDGTTSPQKCEAGTFQPEANGTVCLPASPGYFAQGGFLQLRCGFGFVSGLGAAKCDSCPPGRQASDDQSVCEDVNECERARVNCTPGTVCRNTDGGFACDTIVLVEESTPVWAWVIFALGIAGCLVACLAVTLWRNRRKKSSLAVEYSEDIALTTLDDADDLVGPSATKTVSGETDA